MAGLKSRVMDVMLRSLRQKLHNAGIDGMVKVSRDQFAKTVKRQSKLDRDARLSTVRIDDIPAEWIERKASRTHRVILYFHGGGYCSGSPETHRPMISRLCHEAHARALVPDYRLAPEHPFPAAVEDGLACYRWLLASGLDPAGIVFAGDSAGGGLAVATAMAARDEGLTLPAALVCISPWVDLAQTGRSLLALAKEDPWIDMVSLAGFAHHYLNGELPTNPYASPLYGDFHGLPSMLVHAGSREVLKDDAIRLANKAETQGVDVSVEIWDGMIHVFHALPVKEADAALARLGSFIRSRTVLSAIAKPAAQ